MEESHASSVPIFLMSSQALYHRLLCILYFPAAVPWMHIRSGDAPSRPPGPTPWTRRVKAGKTPQVSYARLQSDKLPGLPQPPGTVWCSDCSNSCCNVIIPGRRCFLRVTLLIPAAEDRDQQGRRVRRENFRALGWLGHSSASTGITQLHWVCNLHPGVLASAPAFQL